MGVVLKRMMMRAATKIADKMGIQALITGEALGQVSSQTLTNLNVINTFKNTFDYSVGYSDHTEGLLALKTAYTMGAEILEFHFSCYQCNRNILFFMEL